MTQALLLISLMLINIFFAARVRQVTNNENTNEENTPETKPKEVPYTEYGEDQLYYLESWMGSFLVDKTGRSLYAWEIEGNGTIYCTENCISYYQPLLYSEEFTKERLEKLFKNQTAADLGAVDRGNNTYQVMYGGLPLYYFKEDKKMGDILGHDILMGNYYWGLIAYLNDSQADSGSTFENVAMGDSRQSTVEIAPPLEEPLQADEIIVNGRASMFIEYEKPYLIFNVTGTGGDLIKAKSSVMSNVQQFKNDLDEKSKESLKMITYAIEHEIQENLRNIIFSAIFQLPLQNPDNFNKVYSILQTHKNFKLMRITHGLSKARYQKMKEELSRRALRSAYENLKTIRRDSKEGEIEEVEYLLDKESYMMFNEQGDFIADFNGRKRPYYMTITAKAKFDF